jgi:hypothetical protein
MYLKHDRSGLSDIKHEATVKCFISDKARTASVLNGLKTTHRMSLLAK